MRILAIDPGTEKSAILQWSKQRIVSAEILDNEILLSNLRMKDNHATILVIEWIEHFGMPAGRDLFETARWIGRFDEAWNCGHVVYLTRKQIKLHICGTHRATDANVRQALIDRYGDPGTKKSPGLLYGIKSHLWAALAVAVTYYDQNGGT